MRSGGSSRRQGSVRETRPNLTAERYRSAGQISVNDIGDATAKSWVARFESNGTRGQTQQEETNHSAIVY